MTISLWHWIDRLMMPEADAWLAGACAGLATIFLVVALVGRTDPSRPICRRCGTDARPYAWRDPPICACGNDLARGGGVKVSRRRGGKARGLAILFALLCLVIGGVGARLVSTGRTWFDLLPTSTLVDGLEAQSDSANGAMARRLATLDPDQARRLLGILVPRPTLTPWSPPLHAVLLDEVLGRSISALRDGAAATTRRAAQPGDIESVVLERMLETTATASLEGPNASAPWGSARIFNAPTDSMAGSTILVRVDEVHCNGQPITWRQLGQDLASLDNSWQVVNPLIGPGDLGVAVGTETAPIVAGASLAIRGTCARIPLGPETVQKWRDASGESIERLIDLTQALVGPVTVDTPVRSAAKPTWQQYSFRSMWSPSFILPPSFRVACAPTFVAMIGGVAAGTSYALMVLFGVAAARGWLGLIPPTCRRCSSLVRGRDDSIPDHCPECGLDLGPVGAVRWARGRRSKLSWVVTVPVACGLGIGLATIIGVAAALSSSGPLRQALADPEGVADRIVRGLLSADQDELSRTIGALQPFKSTKELGEIAPLDAPYSSLAEPLATALLARCGQDVSPSRDDRARACLAALVTAVYRERRIDSAQAQKLLDCYLGPPLVVAPMHASRPGADLEIVVSPALGTPSLSVVAWVTDGRPPSTQWANGSPIVLKLTAPDEPGLHTIDLLVAQAVATAKFSPPPPPNADGSVDATVIDPQRRPVVIEVLAGSDRAPSVADAPAPRDPVLEFEYTLRLSWRRVGGLAQVTMHVDPRIQYFGDWQFGRTWEIWNGERWVAWGENDLVPWTDEGGHEPATLRVRWAPTSDDVVSRFNLDPRRRAVATAPPIDWTFHRVARSTTAGGHDQWEYQP